ncbi:MAG: response regulator [Neomegalonema sp.]|nr:response regulator [Neomegalonema sp.]
MVWLTKARKPNEASPADGGRLEGLAAAMDAAGLGYWIYTPATGALQTSAGLRRIFGKAFPTTVVAEQLYRWFFADSDEEQTELMRWRAEAWRHAWSGKSMFNEEHLARRRDGAEVWVRSIVNSELDAEGRPVRVFGLCQDIDSTKRREIAGVAAGEQIAEESRHKTDFLATMSHEIRTPLNGVLGMAQLLARSELDERQSKCVQVIQSSGKAMLSMLNDALDLSKIEKGLIELCIEPLDLTALAQEVLDSARAHAEDKGLALRLDVEEGMGGPYLGDAQRIRQILANLTFNALKFTTSGSVAIALARSPANPDLVRLNIIDTGPGIAEAECAEIFERFRQTKSEATHGAGRGAGLGLAICSELATLMGGAVGVQSKVGVGSTFWADIQLSRPDERQDAEPQEDASGASPWDGEKEDEQVRILIAEDDPTNQKVFLGALEMSGYEIDIANDGVEAIEALERKRFDLVLMDINMPRMSGDEAIVQIRAADAPFKSVPIIVVTALTSRDARRQYCEMGANDYLAKPIDIEVLVKKVDSMVSALTQA